MQQAAEGFVGRFNEAFIRKNEEAAGHDIEVAAGQAAVLRYSFMSVIVSSGALMCGQWPVAFMIRSVLRGRRVERKRPTSFGAMMSSEHCRMRACARALSRSRRLSEKKVTSANCRAI